MGHIVAIGTKHVYTIMDVCPTSLVGRQLPKHCKIPVAVFLYFKYEFLIILFLGDFGLCIVHHPIKCQLYCLRERLKPHSQHVSRMQSAAKLGKLYLVLAADNMQSNSRRVCNDEVTLL